MLEIEINNRTEFSVPRKKISQVLLLAQKQLKLKNKQPLSMAFVGPAEIRKLNRLYRKKDKVTDVLAFAEVEKGAPAGDFAGEIIICPLQARKQAKQFGESFIGELLRLIVHGYLHLYGFDHQRASEALKMKTMENQILEKFYG